MLLSEKTFIHSIIFCLLIFIPISSFAEERAGELDIFLIAGYGIPIGGHFLDSSKKAEDYYLNYGHGLKINAGVNYNFTNYLGMRVAFNYTAGLPSIKIDYEDQISEYTETFKRNLFGIKVMLVPRFEAFDLFDMYAGIGIGLFFTSLKIENSDKANYPYEGERRTKPALSFNSLVGADFALNDRFTLFGELSFDLMSFNTKSMKPTDSKTQTDFVKDSNSSEHPIKIPGSNFGISIGMRVTILHLEKTPEVF
jgi:opacity protein-like surface antigen